MLGEVPTLPDSLLIWASRGNMSWLCEYEPTSTAWVISVQMSADTAKYSPLPVGELSCEPSAALYKISQQTFVLSHWFVVPRQRATSHSPYCVLQASLYVFEKNHVIWFIKSYLIQGGMLWQITVAVNSAGSVVVKARLNWQMLWPLPLFANNDGVDSLSCSCSQWAGWLIFWWSEGSGGCSLIFIISDSAACF